MDTDDNQEQPLYELKQKVVNDTCWPYFDWSTGKLTIINAKKFLEDHQICKTTTDDFECLRPVDVHHPEKYGVDFKKDYYERHIFDSNTNLVQNNYLSDPSYKLDVPEKVLGKSSSKAKVEAKVEKKPKSNKDLYNEEILDFITYRKKKTSIVTKMAKEKTAQEIAQEEQEKQAREQQEREQKEKEEADRKEKEKQEADRKEKEKQDQKEKEEAEQKEKERLEREKAASSSGSAGASSAKKEEKAAGSGPGTALPVSPAAASTPTAEEFQKVKNQLNDLQLSMSKVDQIQELLLNMQRKEEAREKEKEIKHFSLSAGLGHANHASTPAVSRSPSPARSGRGPSPSWSEDREADKEYQALFSSVSTNQYFRSVHIKRDDLTCVHMFIQKKSQHFQQWDKNVSMAKKLENFKKANIPMYSEKNHGKVMTYLLDEYFPLADTVVGLELLDIAAFTMRQFKSSVAEKVCLATIEACRPFVAAEIKITEVNARKKKVSSNELARIENSRLDVERLRLCIFWKIHLAINTAKQGLEIPAFDTDGGATLPDFYIKVLERTMLRHCTSTGKPTADDISDAMSTMITRLDSEKRQILAGKLRQNSAIAKIMNQATGFLTDVEQIKDKLEDIAWEAKGATDNLKVQMADFETNKAQFGGNDLEVFYAGHAFTQNKNNKNGYSFSNPPKNGLNNSTTNPRYNIQDQPQQFKSILKNTQPRNVKFTNNYPAFKQRFEQFRPRMRETFLTNIASDLELLENESGYDSSDGDLFDCMNFDVCEAKDFGIEFNHEEVDFETNSLAFLGKNFGFIHCPVSINASSQPNKFVNALVDSGSKKDLISEEVITQHGLSKFVKTLKNPVNAKGFSGEIRQVTQFITLYVRVGKRGYEFNFYVVKGLTNQMLLGLPALKSLGVYDILREFFEGLKTLVSRSSIVCTQEAKPKFCEKIINKTNFKTFSEVGVQTMELEFESKEQVITSSTNISKQSKSVSCNYSEFSDINKDFLDRNNKSVATTPPSPTSKNVKNSSKTKSKRSVEPFTLSEKPNDSVMKSAIEDWDWDAKEEKLNTEDRIKKEQETIQKIKNLTAKLNIREKYVLSLILDADRNEKFDENTSLSEFQEIISNHVIEEGVVEEETIKIPIKTKQKFRIGQNDWGLVKVELPKSCALSSWSVNESTYRGLTIPDRLIRCTDELCETVLFVVNDSEEDIELAEGEIVARANKIKISALPSHENPYLLEGGVIAKEDLIAAANVFEESIRQPFFHKWERAEDECFHISHVQTEDDKKAKSFSEIEEYKKERNKIFQEKIINKAPEPLKQVYRDFQDTVFGGDPPRHWKYLNIPPLKLPIQNNIPSFIKPPYRKRPTSDEKKIIEDFLLTNLSRGIIRRSNSNFISPLLIVKKPNGRGFRICADFRNLNEKVFADSVHHIPEIGDIKMEFARKRVYSCWDVSSAYWRLRLDEDSKPYTAFMIVEGDFAGVYEFNVLPFGVKSAVSLFSRVMDECWSGMNMAGCQYFMDDVACGSGEPEDTWDEALEKHAVDCRKIFGRAERYGYTFSIEKAIIAVEKLEYLGYVMGQGLIEPSSKVTKKLADFETLAKLTENTKIFEKIFGFYNYSSSFIKGFAKDRSTVNKLKKMYDELVISTAKSKSADEKTKRENFIKGNQPIVDEIIKKWNRHINNGRLTVPKVGQALDLFVDASKTELGFILRVRDTGSLIDMGSRVLKPEETRYDIHDLELLGTLFGVEKCRPFIVRSKDCTVFTDNKVALGHLTKSSMPVSDRGLKFLSKIQLAAQFCNFKYVATKNNPADSCSRGLLRDKPTEAHEETSIPIIPETAKTNKDALGRAEAEMEESKKVREDSNLVEINYNEPESEKYWVCDFVEGFENEWWEEYFDEEFEFSGLKASNFQPESKIIHKIHDIICQNMESMATQTEEDQEILKIIAKMTHNLHLHVGQKRLKKILEKLYPSKKFSVEKISEVIKNCPKCVERQRLMAENSVGKTVVPDRPGQILNIDHFTPFPGVTSLHKKKTILSIKDAFSKHYSLVPTKTYAHSELIEALRWYFSIFGCVEVIRLDNALWSEEVKRFGIENGTKIIPIPVYRPQSNGSVERIHRDLRRYFEDVIEAEDINRNQWVSIVHKVVHIANSIPHSTTGFSPDEIQTLSKNPGKEQLEIFKLVKERIINSQQKTAKESSGPFPKMTEVKPGQKLWAWLNGKQVPCICMSDHGHYCSIKKLSHETRFELITCHKSKLSLRIEGKDSIDEIGASLDNVPDEKILEKRED